MAKKPLKSQKALSSSSPTSSQTAHEIPKEKMVLRVKSSEKTKRSAQQSKEEETPKLVKKSKAKPKSKGDPNMPKKPPTAFFYFLEDFRKGYQEQNPEVKSMRDIGKVCGEKWRTMTYDEKVQYYDIATTKRAEFDNAMAEYIKRKESGEDQEIEEDSEYDE